MIYYHHSYSQLDLPAHHRFPISKYQQLHARLQQGPLAQYLSTPSQAATREMLLGCHHPEYVDAFLQGTLSDKAIKKMGFPWSQTLVSRTITSVGASIEAAKFALQHGVAANLSGGYHHAHPDFGSGFCIFNDWAVAAAHLINQELAEKVVIFDCDVHQGDGTATCTALRDNIVSCSVHCESNFPRVKPASDYDFALPQGCQDERYLETISDALQLIIRLHQPDIILYNAGADIYQGDELGQLNVSKSGVKARDSLVMQLAAQHNTPLAIALGGGYQRNVEHLVDIHEQTFLALFDNLAIMI